MIEELRIRSLGVIDEAAVVLGPGLTVLSGETGAGKTMVLSGLSLVMGGRADAGMVRRDAERADVEGSWLVTPERSAPIVAAIEEAGGDAAIGGTPTSWPHQARHAPSLTRGPQRA